MLFPFLIHDSRRLLSHRHFVFIVIIHLSPSHPSFFQPSAYLGCWWDLRRDFCFLCLHYTCLWSIPGFVLCIDYQCLCLTGPKPPLFKGYSCSEPFQHFQCTLLRSNQGVLGEFPFSEYPSFSASPRSPIRQIDIIVAPVSAMVSNPLANDVSPWNLVGSQLQLNCQGTPAVVPMQANIHASALNKGSSGDPGMRSIVGRACAKTRCIRYIYYRPQQITIYWLWRFWPNSWCVGYQGLGDPLTSTHPPSSLTAELRITSSCGRASIRHWPWQ
jgi:hypothetical protein